MRGGGCGRRESRAPGHQESGSLAAGRPSRGRGQSWGLANGSFQPCLVGGHWRSAGGSPDSRGDKLEPALYPGPRV